jgi:hypothetical protein
MKGRQIPVRLYVGTEEQMKTGPTPINNIGRSPLYRRHKLSMKFASKEDVIGKLEELEKKGHSIIYVEIESETKTERSVK